MSSLSKFAHNAPHPLPTDLAEPADVRAMADYQADHVARPVPSFWNFLEDDDQAAPTRPVIDLRRSLA